MWWTWDNTTKDKINEHLNFSYIVSLFVKYFCRDSLTFVEEMKYIYYDNRGLFEYSHIYIDSKNVWITALNRLYSHKIHNFIYISFPNINVCQSHTPIKIHHFENVNELWFFFINKKYTATKLKHIKKYSFTLITQPIDTYTQFAIYFKMKWLYHLENLCGCASSLYLINKIAV